MRLPAFFRSARAWFCLVLAVALAWWGVLSYSVGKQLFKVSKIEFRQNPPGMAAGPEAGKPPLILASNAWDGYIWIHHAQDMAERGAWRLKHTDFDHAPDGRGVHWNSGWAWWLIGLGWLDHRITGVPLDSGIARMAMWANPIVFVIFMVAIAGWTARRWGYGPAILVLAAMLAMPGYQEGFAAGYPDHHGLHNAAIAVCLLGLVFGGLGWTRAAGAGAGGRFLPETPTAKMCFVVSALAGACGLWVSALTLTLALVGAGAGACAAMVLAGRRLANEDVECRPELWRLWGWIGGGASLALYLLEYFPAHMGMRLEVNHPFYALAWVGGGELIFRFQRWRCGGAAWRKADWTWSVGALCATCLLPLAMKWGGAVWYKPFDPFLFDLHKRIAEFQPIWLRAPAAPYLATVAYVGGFVVIGAAVLVVVFSRRLPVWTRVAALFVSVAGVGVTVVYFFQVRWGMAASSAWLAAAAVVGLAWAQPLEGWRTTRGVLRTGAVVALAAYPIAVFQNAVASLSAPSMNIERAHGFGLLFRDMAQFIRASVGPEARVVILSSPNTSNPTTYFGRFHTVGTLYWENRDGLFDAATIFNNTDDAVVLRELLARGITHIVYLNDENFLGPYFELQHPGEGLDAWKRTFGYRSFFGGNLPVWARPLAYGPPKWLQELNPDVRLLQIVPEQNVAEAYYHIAEYQLVNGRADGALTAIKAALQVAPQSLPIRIKYAELLLVAGRAEEATRELNGVLPLVPEAERAKMCFDYANLAARAGALVLTEQLLRESVRIAPENLKAVNNLAWILATARDDSLRSGHEALQLARELVRRNPRDALYQGTLGAALAETADFDGAIVATYGALEAAQAGGRSELATAARERLKAFEARRPWRE